MYARCLSVSPEPGLLYALPSYLSPLKTHGRYFCAVIYLRFQLSTVGVVWHSHTHWRLRVNANVHSCPHDLSLCQFPVYFCPCHSFVTVTSTSTMHTAAGRWLSKHHEIASRYAGEEQKHNLSLVKTKSLSNHVENCQTTESHSQYNRHHHLA